MWLDLTFYPLRSLNKNRAYRREKPPLEPLLESMADGADFSCTYSLSTERRFTSEIALRKCCVDADFFGWLLLFCFCTNVLSFDASV